MDEVTLRLCGSFAVTRGAAPGSAVPIGSRKARRLLALLAAHRGRVVDVREIVDALWAGERPRRPEDNVATLVSRLRAALGDGVVLGGRAGYHLGRPPAVRVDVDEATALDAEARRRTAAGDVAPAAAAARRGLDLLGDGEVLVGEPGAAWIDAVRDATAALLRSLRLTLAEAALAAGDPGVAAAAARAATRTDPLDERAHRLLMTAHQAAGEPARALAAYAELRGALADELGVDPAPDTRALHLEILRGTRVDPPRRPPIAVPAAPPTPAGREAELETLRAAWSAAAAGRTAALLLTGEAGIGKTTLAAAAAGLARTTGGQVLEARCYAAERSLLLQPVLDALGPALRTRPPGAVRQLAGAGAGVLAALLPEAVTAPGEPALDRGSAELVHRRTCDAIIGLLRALAAERPVLLVLDDLHNAGVSTLELLHYLVRRPATARLLVLATVRTEEGAPVLDTLGEVCGRLDVGPLSAAAVALLASRAGAPRLAEDILRRTRGHTLFVVETLRGLAAGEAGVPESLQAAVLARLRRADPEVERVLRAGAVLGAAVPPQIVSALLDLPLPEVVQRCEQAAAARLLVPAGEAYEFANDLVQESLLATTPAPTRAAHHRRAADLLADHPEAEAAHAAAVADWPRAARAWLRAGEAALGRFAAADAQALLAQALDAAGRVDAAALTGRVHLARARAREALGAFGPAVADLEAALAAARAAGDRGLEMAALRHYAGDLTSALGLPERARRLDAGLRIAMQLGDRGAQADLYGWQAVVAANQLRFTDAIELGRRAVTAGRAAGTEEALGAGLDGLKTAYAYLGDTARLTPVLGRLEPLLRRRGDLRLLSWAVFESALPAVAAADWDTATARVAEAMEINERSGFRVHRAWLVAHQGWIARLRGRLDEAVALGHDAVGLAAAAGHDWWRSTANALLATTLLERGEVADAVALLTEARSAAERGGAEGYLLRCLAPLAEATGDPAVLAEAEVLLGGVRAPHECAWLAGGDAYLSVARAWLARDEPVRARAALAPLLDAADRHGWLPWQAAGAVEDAAALAGLGDPDGAARQVRRALALAERHGMPTVAARARDRLRGGYSSSASRAAARAAPPGSTGR
ncbi:ATP-binding protein [Pseudonocardia asaccharolytica]|uniref:SARP family transcriptional regulator n=1 Tax=Pseudonocardia asaccharolytica DSM 44247 = NBRC 16224 TaxID=1123024 RepID=A0A511CYZ8_9PSEU|nr:AAA family ATPase [Pseudonocardia asaccharolytica]GEL17770.1 hypothetical protein PA7_16070 [Pseudonocardia asaccharolytica DSM 44247 = NBRC 16224]